MARFTFPAQAVPMSGFLSPEAKAYVTQHLKDMQDPHMLAQDNGVPRFMKGYLERQKVLYPVDRDDTKIAGVHAYVYTPKAGISAANRDRVLIDLHGGGLFRMLACMRGTGVHPDRRPGQDSRDQPGLSRGTQVQVSRRERRCCRRVSATPERSHAAKHRHLRLLRGRYVDGNVGCLV